jgi:hypothetical protein
MALTYLLRALERQRLAKITAEQQEAVGKSDELAEVAKNWTEPAPEPVPPPPQDAAQSSPRVRFDVD